MPALPGGPENDDDNDPVEAAPERVPRLSVTAQQDSYPTLGTQDDPEYLRLHMDELNMHTHWEDECDLCSRHAARRQPLLNRRAYRARAGRGAPRGQHLEKKIILF